MSFTARTTGKVRWKQDRQHLERVTRAIGKMSYSTPLTKVIDGVPQLVSSGADHVAAYDPETYEVLCLPDEPIPPEVIGRLWDLGLLKAVL